MKLADKTTRTQVVAACSVEGDIPGRCTRCLANRHLGWDRPQDVVARVVPPVPWAWCAWHGQPVVGNHRGWFVIRDAEWLGRECIDLG
jgi:hypothetical protein